MRIARFFTGILILGFAHLLNSGAFANSPHNLIIVPNQGQLHNTEGGSCPQVIATTESPGTDVFFRENGLSYVYRQAAGDDQVNLYRMDLNFLGSLPQPAYEFAGEQTAYRMYFGEGIEEGKRVSEYNGLSYRNLYPGIDLRFETKDGHLKYTFEVLPGADPSAIRMQYSGADQISLLSDGRLQVENSFGTLIEDAPVAFLENGTSVASHFVLKNGILSFEVGPEWDGSQKLYIDPTLYWATMYGGTGEENDELFGDVGADSQGNIYYSGHTSSTNFPVSVGPYQASNAGGTMDATLAKFSPSGTRLWATYFGGSGYDIGSGIAFDSQDNVYFCGSTTSANFPVTVGSFGGGIDGFAVKMSPAGQRLWATFIGANTADEAYRLELDASDNLFVVGKTSSPAFSTTPGAFQSTFGGLDDGFLVKFNPQGSLIYASYLGGSTGDYPYGLAVGPDGSVYVSGYTQSNNFPVSSGAFQSANAGVFDAFVMRFTNAGSLIWSTYFGGSGADITFAIAVDAAGNCYGTGQTNSTNMPVSSGAYQSTYGATNFTAFVFKFDVNGARDFSTYLGGSTWQRGLDVALSATQDLLITGNTKSTNFPLTTDAHQSTYGGGNDDAFISKMSPTGGLLYSTYYGGNNNDFGRGIGQHPNGDFFITGYTESSNFPTTNGAFQTTYAGSKDAFIVTFDDCGLIPTLLSGQDTLTYCQGSTLQLDAGAGPASYLWSTNATSASITVSTPGTYWVQVMDTSNCTSTDTVRVIEVPQANAAISPGSGDLCPGATLPLTGSGGSSLQWYLNGTAIPGATQSTYNATAAGNYTLVAANSPDCRDSTTSPVVITAVPAPTPNLGPDTTICPGSTLQIDAGPGGNYLWCDLSTSQTVLITQPGTYCVTVTNASGCTGTDSVVIDFATLSAAFTSSSYGPLAIEFTDASTNAVSWAWDFGDGGVSNQASPMHVFLNAGTFQVCLTITDANGCMDSFCDSVTVTSVAVNPGMALRFEISPQPADDWIQIGVFSLNSEPARLRLIDLQGRELRSATLSGQREIQLNWSVSDLAAGLYLLRLESESGTMVKKVLVE